MNKYEEFMKDLMEEQEIILLQIEYLKEQMKDEKQKHIKDYYNRELLELYEDLYNSCLDIQTMFENLTE